MLRSVIEYILCNFSFFLKQRYAKNNIFRFLLLLVSFVVFDCQFRSWINVNHSNEIIQLLLTSVFTQIIVNKFLLVCSVMICLFYHYLTFKKDNATGSKVIIRGFIAGAEICTQQALQGRKRTFQIVNEQ